MKTIDDLNFSGKKALIRVDFNVPLDDQFNITDDNRIQGAAPTIKKILKDGGSVILMSHLGRPKDGPTDKYSLKHIVSHLSKVLGVDVQFAADCIGQEAVDKAASLKSGEVLLLENLRFYKEEEKGDVAFAEKLSKLGDVYVNDAFGTAHRAHASTAVIAQFFPGNKYFGYLMAAEVQNAEKVLNHPERPFTAIMGGAKVSDKLELIEALLEKVDNLIIGGGMAYTFVKARGGEIGQSLVELDKLDLANHLVKKAEEKGVNLVLPTDSQIADRFANDAEVYDGPNDQIPADKMGLDIGKESGEHFAEIISASKTILWNGPMGVFEMDTFAKGTKAVADAVVAATERGAFSLIGGGDSAAAVSKFKMTEHVSYVSTGGGALLEYMEGKELPGVKAINE
ncbi:phosphoglycerate kinase [Sphingobacterium spiritivorum]|uniref:Phosphoglycerate kinase n=1 Tax=Sphingobacterium spiritivorum ATCC 33861 TaxID=525373 RepID=D7VKS5_SPHSI|nr:phosphoglycerate kinase [Sphingobacterium spiritivorum]EFK58877.1 phosphoglycerate kinase [Sphingobacterium spiritivorum ATCC 33861]QQT34247.1 phosphoglycerate kinase [Sphingobacterium spiritivorum]WQD35087.1 phosphoglycerate kinase [Sphingobacterium spiritivorum]SUI99347.1 Phosphoglycerate kinase [Sphingobacterium spiritivorum]